MALTFVKTKGFADGAGQEYEIKVAALLFLRALTNTQQFYIATNLAAAGAFDDVVIAYKLEGRWRKCFIQLKHKTGKKSITFQSLTDLSSKGDFSLVKYCKSYIDIKAQFDKDKDDPVFGGDFQNSNFIIFTNANLDDELSRRTRTSRRYDVLLQCNNDVDSVFSFCQVADADIYLYFQDLLRLQTVLDPLDLHTISKEDLQGTLEHFKSLISKRLSKILNESIEIGGIQRIKDGIRDLRDCNDFLRNMLFFVAQPNEEEMSDIIKQEIQNYFHTESDVTKAIWRDLYENISQWWKKENFYLTETSHIWQKIIQKRMSILSQQKLSEINDLKMKFKEDKLLPISNEPEINIVTKSTLLTCLKVCQSLNCPHLVIGLKSLLHLHKEVLAIWPSIWCTTLVVDCEAAENIEKFSYSQSPGSRFIVISRERIEQGICLPDRILFSDLDDRSQLAIGEKKVVFQGFEVELKSLLTEKSKESMDQEFAIKILTSTKITIGKSVVIANYKFIQRSLKQHVYVRRAIFERSELYGVLAVSGITQYDVQQILPHPDVCTIEHTLDNCWKFVSVEVSDSGRILTNSKRSHYHFYPERNVDPRFCQFTIIAGYHDFILLCEKFENVHWIELHEGK